MRPKLVAPPALPVKLSTGPTSLLAQIMHSVRMVWGNHSIRAFNLGRDEKMAKKEAADSSLIYRLTDKP
ncbi:MAG: hypothetical protein KDJ36_16520, partial [Hyphomicrobiaceae bacterium]|nr:hypothetical protein [Hyphomicrobiaceae bacterium]